MTYEQALHNFWSSFGWKAYDNATVPSGDFAPEMPRITYDVAKAEFGATVAMSASLWDRGFWWDDITVMENTIYREIGLGGVLLDYDGGQVWIRRGTPFSQRMSDEDDTIRRIYLNIEAENFTAE